MDALSSACLMWWFIIAILLIVWVYKDAESRGMNGALWMMIFLFSGPLGPIVYLIVRKPKQTYQNYQNIDGYQSFNSQYSGQQSPQVIYKEKEIIKEIVKVKCPYCGTLVEQGLDRCPQCGAPIR